MKNGFILFLILCKNVWSTIGEELLLKDLPASFNQIKDLTEAVCSDLFFDSTQIKRNACHTNFMSEGRNSNETQAISVKCQSEIKIDIAVTPSKFMQLIILINDKKNTEIINYILIEPNERYGRIFTPSGNSSFWMTTLNEVGVPSLWKRGPEVKSWEIIKRNIQNKSYDIEIRFSEFLTKNGKSEYFLKANFSWNTTDTSDSCFDVLNSCNKKTQGNLFQIKIKPYQERKTSIDDLPLDDSCTIRVTGKYGTTVQTYRTPACEKFPQCAPLPDIPKNVTLHPFKYENDDLWIVRVRWARPRRAPMLYNITLRTNDSVRNFSVSGNVTEVQFQRVRGAGLYNVSVAALSASGAARTSRHDFFPLLEQTSSSVTLLFGAAWSSSLLVLAALLFVVVYWRRRLLAIQSRIYDRDFEKIAQEGDIDIVNSEPGTEDQWEVRPERLLLHEVIGEGAFGVVRRGTFAPCNKDVAVKMLKGFPSVDEIRSFRAEMELMKSVGAHPHVVSLIGCCSGRRPLIVAEYCSRGDLLSYLRCSWEMMISRRNLKYYNNSKVGINDRNYFFKNKSTDTKFVSNRLYDLEGACDTELTYRDLLSFSRQIAMGMEFLASNRVVHRDLAARNVLVTADRTLKIADFGLSRDVYQENQYKQEGNGKMPVKWMALESLTHRIYTTQSDVWSFGVVLWEVVTVGGAPYAGVGAARLPRLLAAGYRMPRPPHCAPDLYNLMLSCWKERPRSRPTFSELHEKLDEMLYACADHYLSLVLPVDLPETHVRPHRYIRMLISYYRGKRKRAKSYERPLAASTNHYTDQPAAAAKAGLVLCS
ncbi:tyrosine-protein kinase receptor torso-like isoform X1 [Vanessa atalanta]|uniref:tyrosine-protein kinase receptor torso-like isoform X1 n=1 Tax=Vanessa atalanta TaxID=42275 RepID=UPI001FCCCC70|nr:tyrosine-protein kinase receptor torso-like isoform X1 [Vanessa atalanta]